MLELESPPLANQHLEELNKSQRADEAESSPDTQFNPEDYFDRWLADLHSQQPSHEGPDGEGIYFESARASKCEVTFEGVLHFDGYTLGNIRSPEGTLILAKEGRVEADIDVGMAVIRGSVTGNIRAPEGVILDSDARVAGQIHTRILSVRVGALFDGDCLSVPMPAQKTIEELSGRDRHDRVGSAQKAPLLARAQTG